MKGIKIKCASGLGDAIYMRPIVEYYYKRGYKVEVMTDYDVIYDDLNVLTTKHSKSDTHLELDMPWKKISYCIRKYKPETTQFEDVCLQAGIPVTTPFNYRWKTRNKDLMGKVKKLAGGKPICLISAPFKPFGRVDNWGHEMTVDFSKMDELIALNKDKYYYITVNKEKPLYKLNNIDLDLCHRTSVADLFDLVSIADVCMGQVGHILPLSEVFNKPALLFFSANGFKCGIKFIEAITPGKVIHKKKLIKYVIDDWPIDKINKVFQELRYCVS